MASPLKPSPSPDGYRTTRDAEVCICGLARAEHRRAGKYAGMSNPAEGFCLAFRTVNPSIPNPAYFAEVCEQPEQFGGLKWPPPSPWFNSSDR